MSNEIGLTPEVIVFPTEFLKDAKGQLTTVNPKSKEYVEQQDKSKFEFVTIPAEDIFNKPHQGVAINGVKLERGHTYSVGPTYAREIRERLAISQKADLRILQSHPDVKAVNDQQRSGSSSGGSTFVREV